MGELGSWFCGSLSSGTFILDTETEAAHLPAAPRPEGKEDPAAAGSSLSVCAASLLQSEPSSEGQRPRYENQPLAL